MDELKSDGIVNFMQSHYGRCKQCGQAGVQDAFYSKLKQFCSLNCCRVYSLQSKRRPVASKTVKDKLKNGKITHQQRKVSLTNSESEIGLFNWNEYLERTGSTAAPVSTFKHCALSNLWDSIDAGVKVEVKHVDSSSEFPVYWIATIVSIAGYRCLLRYEGCGDDASLDFWISLLSGDVHRVGWCAVTGHALVTPQAVQWRRTNWREYIIKQLIGAQTLPSIVDELSTGGIGLSNLVKCLPVGAHVEVVDKTCISAMSIATVERVVGGRLHLRYIQNCEEFWCHTLSSLLHPIGWSLKVGHKLHADPELHTNTSLTEVTPDMFLQKQPVDENSRFVPGMKLEAIDPLNLSTICVATVTKLLGDGYIMVGIDGSAAYDGSDWFCYHSSSPCIFPAGFCKINNLELTPPRGYVGVFDWCSYLRDTNSSAAPVALFNQMLTHGFEVGMKLEAADLMDSKLICVATVVNVIGRLLRIHFDGWESTYDQYLDCRSPDIYPVGWCELVGHKLEAPPSYAGSSMDSNHRSLSSLAAKRKKSTNALCQRQEKVVKTSYS